MSYPTLPTDQPDASERFLLTSADREVVGRGRNDPQRLGLAVLLKVYQAIGYVPSKGMIPRGIVQRVADQIDVSPTQFRRYSWTGRTWRRHVGWIRVAVGLRPLGASDFTALRNRLVEVAADRPSRADLLVAAVTWCQRLALELPPESAMRRLVQSW